MLRLSWILALVTAHTSAIKLPGTCPQVPRSILIDPSEIYGMLDLALGVPFSKDHRSYLFVVMNYKKNPRLSFSTTSQLVQNGTTCFTISNWAGSPMVIICPVEEGDGVVNMKTSLKMWDSDGYVSSLP